jgi:hypothetical protein
LAPDRKKLSHGLSIVELTLDADDNVIERRIVPHRYQAREETVDTIEA